MQGRTIFLSYAKPDRVIAENYYKDLVERGYSPWMDTKELVAGQDWDFELRRALDAAALIVVFISNNSVSRRGYVQREMKLAIEKAEEKLSSDIFIIPIAIDDVERPAELQDRQFIDARQRDSIDQLERAIKKQFANLGLQNQSCACSEKIHTTVVRHEESHDGLPGFDITADSIKLMSTEHPRISDASDYIWGRIADMVMAERRVLTEQDARNYRYSQDRWSRTNTLDMILNDFSVTGRTLSVMYHYHHYYAGAAHPVSCPLSFNFFLTPVTRIESFRSLFEDDEALTFIQEKVRLSLIVAMSEQTDTDVDTNWVREGTSDWSDFDCFYFKDRNVSFHFGSYKVGAYAYGLPSASLAMEEFAGLLTEDASFSLNLQYQRRMRRQELKSDEPQ